MRIRVAAAVAGVVLALTWRTQAGDLTVELRPERSALLAGSKVSLGAILDLKAPDAGQENSPAAVSMSLVMDRSGSMSDAGKIEMVHVAGEQLVDKLEPDDRLGLVAYSTNVEVLRPLKGITDPVGIKRLIRELTPTDSTNLGGGLMEGIKMFGERRADGTVRRLLLLTDGLANAGETS